MANKPKNRIAVAGNPPVKRVQVKNVIPSDLPLVFTDNLLIQNRDTMFTLSFMQTDHPLILTEEDARQITEVTSIAKCRVVMTALSLAKSIRAMQDNFAKFLINTGLDVNDLEEFLEKYDPENKNIDSTTV